MNWPNGETMAVCCPNCGHLVDVQIAVVREENLPLRPAECDQCLADFELSMDGSTELLSAPPKKTTQRGRELLKELQGLTFDPGR